MIHKTKIRLKRTLLTLLAGAILIATASCDKRESWLPFGEKKSTCEKAYDSLEAQFQDLKATVTGGTTSADRTAFWQATAALFIVLSGFALVGGAALGSRARLARERFRQPSASTTSVSSTPEEFPA